MPMRRFLTGFLAFLSLFATNFALAGEQTTVFAAASLHDVLESAALEYRRSSGRRVRLIFAASSVLARQIEAGAPADLYVSANADWVNWLDARNLIDASRRRHVAGNTLVVGYGAHAGPPRKLDEMLTLGRFAMGDPSHVPAGAYAASALEHLGLWQIVRSNAVYCENVRVALEFLRRGEVVAAIVYGSDLATAPELVKAFDFPRDSHAPIRYVAVPVVGGNANIGGFLEYLSGAQGRALFARFGFAEAG